MRPRGLQRDRRSARAQGAATAPSAGISAKRHAAEYNRNWNYFAGLSPEEAARRAAEEEQGNSGFRQSAQWKWGGPGDGSRSRDEMRALDALELDSDADFKAVKAAHRRLVKETHPDANPGDEEAAKRFKQVQAAYDVLQKGRRAEERKAGLAGILLCGLRRPRRSPGRRSLRRRSGLCGSAGRGWSCGVRPCGGQSCGGLRRLPSGRGSCPASMMTASASESAVSQPGFAPPSITSGRLVLHELAAVLVGHGRRLGRSRRKAPIASCETQIARSLPSIQRSISVFGPAGPDRIIFHRASPASTGD